MQSFLSDRGARDPGLPRRARAGGASTGIPEGGPEADGRGQAWPAL